LGAKLSLFNGADVAQSLFGRALPRWSVPVSFAEYVVVFTVIFR